MATLKRREEQKRKDCWDLTRLVKNLEDYTNKIKAVTECNQKIVQMKGHILDNKETLKNFLKYSEKEERILSQLYIYVRLKFDEDTSNKDSKKRKLEIEQLMNTLSDNESFIMSELMKKDYKDILSWIENDDDLKKYGLYFERIYRKKKRILSEAEEKIIIKAVNAFGTPDEAFHSLDTTDSSFDDVILDNGTRLPLSHYNWSLFLENPSQNVRRRAFHSYYKFYEKHKNTYASLLKGNYQELEFLRDIKKYDSALEMALDEINVSKDVYDTLIKNVHQYMDINIKYQKLKAKILKNMEYHLYDTYVPIVSIESKKYSLKEAVQVVTEALKPLKEDYIKHFQKVFSDHSVDIYPNEFKQTGAYQWGCFDSPSYVLLNFNGTYDSVSTLAHELGHAVHSMYSKENNPYVYSDYEIFLAEIASTVNETLLSFYFLEHANSKKAKMFYLCEFLDKVKATIYRQTMFAEFESILSQKCQNKESLTEDLISSVYYKLNEDYFKDSVIIDPEIRYEWMRISHFYTPFYVYQYATGLISAICIVRDIMDKKEGFVEKYLEFLKSGSNKEVLDILKIVDIDLTKNEPFEKAFSFIADCLEQLNKIVKEGECYE